jgi:3',5'-cyclic AMP phosphodiesterase CpdA
MNSLAASIRLAHLSDWHATTLTGGGLARFRGKRISGWASWALSRRHRHAPAILEAAIEDVHRLGIEQTIVTGDLTHVSLEQEFIAAAQQLSRLGEPDRVFVIPGNHDAYVPMASAASWDHWADYLRGGGRDVADRDLAASLSAGPVKPGAPGHADYPVLRINGRLAMVGLCSAVPTPIFRAGGELGAPQLERLEELLLALRDQGMCRVVLVHHPVTAEGEPERRALRDRAALRGVLERAGAELVVHGHKHRRRVAWLQSGGGLVPAIGVPSSSEVGSRPGKSAQYHVYTLTRDEGGRWGLTGVAVRAWDPARSAFGPASDPFPLDPRVHPESPAPP